MIIIEGPDDSGKSTLANLLSIATGFHTIHSPGVIKHNETWDERKYWYHHLAFLQNIIIDRCFYISEYVYGHVLRNHSMVDKQSMIDFVKHVTMLNGIFVFCEQTFPSKNKNDALHLSKVEREKLEEDARHNDVRIRARYRDVYKDLQKYMNDPVRIKSINDYAYVLHVIRRRYER